MYTFQKELSPWLPFRRKDRPQRLGPLSEALSADNSELAPRTEDPELPRAVLAQKAGEALCQLALVQPVKSAQWS